MQCLLLDTSQWIRYNLYPPTAHLPPIRRNMTFTNNHNTRWKRICTMKGEKILQVSREGRVNFGWGPGCNATWENTWRIDQGIIRDHSYSQFPAVGENYTFLPFEFRNVYVACFATNGSGSVCAVCLGFFPVVVGTPIDVQMEAALAAITYQSDVLWASSFPLWLLS